MNLKNLSLRMLFGGLYVLLVLLCLYGGEKYTYVLFGHLMMFSLFEYYRIIEKKTKPSLGKFFNVQWIIFIYIAAIIFIKHSFSDSIREFSCLRGLLPLSVIAYLGIHIFRCIHTKKENSFVAMTQTVFAPIYICFGVVLFVLLAYLRKDSYGTFSSIFPLSLLIFIWVNDSFAYLVGSLIGKHKLSPRISPNKSVEGFIGGLFFAMVASFFVYKYLDTTLSFPFWIGFSIIVSLSGTLGDLFESLLKRTFGVKDSGTILPGHGGILDRIDSLLLAAPFTYLYIWFTLPLL